MSLRRGGPARARGVQPSLLRVQLQPGPARAEGKAD